MLDRGRRACLQDGSLTWLLAGGLSSSLRGPYLEHVHVCVRVHVRVRCKSFLLSVGADDTGV